MTEVDALGAWTPTEETEIKEQELWNLDATLTDYILPRITAFRKMKRHSYPIVFESVDEQNEMDDRNMAEWENILRSIELAFTTMRSDQHFERSTSQNDDIKKGLKLFAEYYEYLWD